MVLDAEQRTGRDVTVQVDLLLEGTGDDGAANQKARAEARRRIDAWLAENTDDAHVLKRKLVLLGDRKFTDRRSGSNDWPERQEVIDEVGIWLGHHDDHPGVANVYTQYLHLVEWWAHPMQRPDAGAAWQHWISRRPEVG